MSMQTYVFFNKENMPSVKRLQKSIKKYGFDYELPVDFVIDNSQNSFIDGRFEGLESGFDYSSESYQKSDWSWGKKEKKKIGKPDTVALFNSFSNAQEIVGMMIVSSVLTELTDGVMLSEFFDEDLVTAKNSINFAKNIVQNSREQFDGPSTTRQALLSVEPTAHNLYGIKETKEGYKTPKHFADEVLETLQEANIDLTEEIEFAYYLYLSSKKSAKLSSKDIKAYGMECEISVDEESNENPYLCYATMTMKAEAKKLEEVGELLLGLRDRFDGDLDGWEMVPDFDLFGGDLADMICEETAQNIIRDAKAIYTPPIRTATPDYDEFTHLDMKVYKMFEATLKEKGFKTLGDIEYKNVTDLGLIKTFSRVMQSKNKRIIASFYDVVQLPTAKYDFLSLLPNGKILFTVSTAKYQEVSTYPNIDIAHYEDMEISKLYKKHKKRLKRALKKYKISKAERLNTMQDFIDISNKALQYKYKKIKSIGWVTKKYLLAHTGGDEEMTECIYKAIQKIVADEKELD